jgi:hypothetical protein
VADTVSRNSNDKSLYELTFAKEIIPITSSEEYRGIDIIAFGLISPQRFTKLNDDSFCELISLILPPAETDPISPYRSDNE